MDTAVSPFISFRRFPAWTHATYPAGGILQRILPCQGSAMGIHIIGSIEVGVSTLANRGPNLGQG
jgi:hypothetical protein